MEKRCYKCETVKSIMSFSKDSRKKDGLCVECKDCRKAYYNVNIDRFKEWNASHYKENPDIHKAKKERLKETNPDYFKGHYKINRESKREYLKRYNKENRNIINKRYKERYQSDPEFRITQTYRNRVRDAIKKGYKKGKSLDLLGTTIPELKTYLEEHFLPTMTWDNYGTLWHIDHIKPCSSFDLNNEGEQRKCFHYTNLQPLFAVTTIVDGIEYIGNLEKSDKLVF